MIVKQSSHRLRLLLAVFLGGVAAYLTWQRLPPPRPEPAPPPAPPAAGQPWFEDVTRAAGLDFTHFDGASPLFYLQEAMGAGLGWIDYDADGWPDLVCVQGARVKPDPSPGPAPTCKLYRNRGDGTFADVTEQTGLARACLGMGCAVGDYDNDGFDDLLLTFWGGVALYHNVPDGRGGRRFADVTGQARLHDPHWATSAGWGDVDGDGHLDLYVCNYVEVDLDHYPECRTSRSGERYTCPPFLFPRVAHRLFRNNRDGTFTDVSAASGVASAPPAPGLGVLLADLDGDGKTDIYVANDLKPSYLFHNRGGGQFVDKALFSGAGLGPGGRELSGMGVEAVDADETGRPSVFVTNFHNEPNVLFRNLGGLVFHDWTERSGLGPPSIARLGFGCVGLDADLDGKVDLAVANGHVSRNAEEAYAAPFAQEAQLFLGLGGGRYRDVSTRAGDYFTRRYAGRGLAAADFDNDGLVDLAFSHNGGPVVLLKNRTRTTRRGLRLELLGNGTSGNRNAVGARVEVEANGTRQVRWVTGGGSYLSASERRLRIGLGNAGRADRVTVTWPSGKRQVFRDLDAGRPWRLREGEEQPQPVR